MPVLKRCARAPICMKSALSPAGAGERHYYLLLVVVLACGSR